MWSVITLGNIFIPWALQPSGEYRLFSSDALISIKDFILFLNLNSEHQLNFTLGTKLTEFSHIRKTTTNLEQASTSHDNIFDLDISNFPR